MSDDRYRKTRLWTRTLEARVDDPDRDERELLRNAYISMRARVAPLAAQVHQDCHGLTVHDVTHLDALWETADKIIGEDYPINPVEAFVFGAAVLIHDAAMAVAAYDGGLTGVKSSPEWRTAVNAALRRQGENELDEDYQSLSPEIEQSIIFQVLRSCHAKQAERMMEMKWGNDPELYLLENSELRDYYGERIGRIAHSHHWDISKVDSEFQREVAPMVSLNSEWILNEIKVACMLRCADAAHIDARRAPKMLYAIKNPEGISRNHWDFQSKIGQISRIENEIIYSSKSFTKAQVAPWWLAYDLAKLIDSEISQSNSILQENSTATFAARGVRGTSSPKLFARDVPVSGWEPVEAEVRVTDPVHLAQTLGGRNLYGEGFEAPIREIFQNAVDAVRGRRGLRTVKDFPGCIRITAERSTKEPDRILIHFDDNGMGMSQRLMIGPLIDFGKSIWSSPTLLEEYPDLDASSARPVGKFGIGFFSVFLLGKDVRVTSRKYGSSTNDTRTLEFSALNKRPILRKPTEGEISDGFSTRVTVLIGKQWSIVGDQAPDTGDDDDDYADHQERNDKAIDLGPYVMQMSAALDIDVKVNDLVNGNTYSHSHEWETSEPSQFLNELLHRKSALDRSRIIDGYAHLLRPVVDDNGRNLGRAALLVEKGGARLSRTGFISVEGVSYTAGHGNYMYPGHRSRNSRDPLPYVGILNGSTDNAARRFAENIVPKKSLAAWLTEQASLIDRKEHEVTSLVPVTHNIIREGGEVGSMPAFYRSGHLISFDDAREFISNSAEVTIILRSEYNSNLEWLDIEQIESSLYLNDILPDVYVPATDNDDLYEDSREASDTMDSLPQSIGLDEITVASGADLFLGLVEELWGDFEVEISRKDIFSKTLKTRPPLKPVLIITKKQS